MRGYNKCIFAGNLTADPVVRHTQKGTSVANASIAVNRVTKSKDGATHEEVLFLDCVWWGRSADIIGEYGFKGCSLLVEGELKQSDYQTREGENRRKMELNVRDFTLLSKKEGYQPSPHEQQKSNGYQDDPLPF